MDSHHLKVLITGGAGFIGSNFVNWLVQHNPSVEITVLDALTYAANTDYIQSHIHTKKIKFVHGNICDSHVIDELIVDKNIIFNFAAESHVDKSISSPDAFITTNIVGCFKILECIRKFSTKTRLIQISTDEVYGSLHNEDPAFSEDFPIKPSSPYSSSKAAADLLVLSYYKTYGLDVVITRSSNNYGRFQYPEKFIPVVINKILENKKIPVYGNGKNIRDWIFVDDNCSGIWAASQKGVAGEVYNLGGNNEISNIDLVKIILKKMNRDESLISYVNDRPGHDFRYALDTSKSHKLLGWKATSSFEQRIEEVITWYKNQKTK